MQSCVVFNSGTIPETAPGTDTAGNLRSRMNRLSAEFFDTSAGRVDYDGMRSSEEFRKYVETAATLRNFDLSRLGSPSERIAFWINIYNVLVAHGIIHFKVRESVREVRGFFTRFCYEIASLRFSPDDIEHGILRGNRRPPYRIFRRFSGSDPRRNFMVQPCDPRIHFTLVCGSASCPPINYYLPEKIEEQLNLAASAFINGPDVEIIPDRNLIRLSPIFRWYSDDFGGRKGIIDFLLRYRLSEEDRAFISKQGMNAKIRWKAYSWLLNH